MAISNYVLNFNDPTKTGLALTFTTFNTVTLDSSVPPPVVIELSNGFYKFSFDIEATGDDIYYVVDDGGTNILTGVIDLKGNDSLFDLLLRTLGLTQENQAIDNTVYDGNANLLTARLRTYKLAGSVGTDNDVLGEYSITATYTGTNLETYQVVKI